jgi:hypothetical protein
MAFHSPSDQFSRRAVQLDGTTIKVQSVCTLCGYVFEGSRLGEPDISELENIHARECFRKNDWQPEVPAG